MYCNSMCPMMSDRMRGAHWSTLPHLWPVRKARHAVRGSVLELSWDDHLRDIECITRMSDGICLEANPTPPSEFRDVDFKSWRGLDRLERIARAERKKARKQRKYRCRAHQQA
jgi:hypothetical protein